MSSRRRASPLHATRPAVAAAYCGALVLTAIVVVHPLVLGALALSVFAAALGAGARARVLRSLRLSLPMVLLIVAVNALVNRNGLTVLARLGDAGPFGQLDITLEALCYGADVGLVLVVFVACCALASSVIDADELLRSVRRVSLHSALSATIATRMVPLLAQDARRVGEAQRCRLHPGGRTAVLRAITTGALDRSLDIAATLEVRGYGSARRPARLRRPWSRHDLAFACSAAAICALAIAVPAPFQFYPQVQGRLDAGTLALAAAIALAALAPFAQRRGIER